MPITKSAKKAIRSSARKRVYNEKRKRAMKEIIKRIEKLAKSNNQTDKKEAQKLLASAYQAIDKAMKGGIVKKNNAARKKSRLAKLLK